MPSCCVVDCFSNSKKKSTDANGVGIKYNSFPVNENLINTWLSVCRRPTDRKINTKYAKVCSLHFTPEDYGPKRRLLFNAVPSRKLPSQRFLNPIPIENSITSSTIPLFEVELPIEHHTHVEEGLHPVEMEIIINSTPTYEISLPIEIPASNIIVSPSPPLNEWTANQIADSYAMYAKSPNLYADILNENYKVAPINILLDTVSKIHFNEGLLKPVLEIMNIRNPTKQEHLCILIADEMEMQPNFYFDENDDYLHGPANRVQVLMVTGLLEDWCYPVYYDYDIILTRDLIIEVVVNELSIINYKVVAVVSNLDAHNPLARNTSEPYFLNSSNDQKIFLFWNTLHLLNAFRNHICSDYVYYQNKELRVNPLLDLFQNDEVDLNLCLTEEHFNVQFVSNSKIKYAQEFFSNQNSKGLREMGMRQVISSPNWEELVDFMELVNNWYDVFNSNHTNIDNQHTNDTLHKMETAMISANVHKSQPFQEGVIENIIALRMLCNYLKDEYNITSIATNKINLNLLENLFDKHLKKSDYSSPKSNEFINHLKMYLLGSYKEIISNLNLHIPSLLDLDETKDLLNNLDEFPFYQMNPNTESLTDEEYENLQEEASLYIPLTMIQKYYEMESSKPSFNFIIKLRELQNIFHIFNSTTTTSLLPLKTGKNYLESLIILSETVQIEEDIRRFYFLKKLNAHINYYNNHIDS